MNPLPKHAPRRRHQPEALTLVPLDGSPQAERALPFAIAHTKASGARLALAGIAPHPPTTTTPPAAVNPPTGGPGSATPPLTLYLRWIAETLAERGVTVEVSVCGGAGAQAIADAARLWGADLVVATAHDFGGPPGDVRHLAKDVLRRAAVPVLLIPSVDTPTAHEDHLISWHGWLDTGTSQPRARAAASEGGRA